VAEAGNEDLQRSPKRRMLEPVPNGLSMGSGNVQVQSPGTSHSHWSPSNFRNKHFNGQTPNATTNTPAAGLFPEKEDVQVKSSSTAHDVSSKVVSRPHTSDGQEEEAAVLGEPRMLEDPTGRFCESHSSSLTVIHHIRY
jgi:hypothetical protein